MNGRDIGERFIRAVEIGQRVFSDDGPKIPRKAAWIEFAHTHADKNGWGTEALAQERKAFWNAISKAPTARQISEAEETQSWLQFVENEDERVCLTMWAYCLATKSFFKDWCKEEGITYETGRRRKERAILRILLAFNCGISQHNEIEVSALLPDTPEISDKSDIIGEGATHWISEAGRPLACDFDSALGNFDWAEKQNERRRQREAKRRRQQEAA
jgi:hypothetical protein